MFSLFAWMPSAMAALDTQQKSPELYANHFAGMGDLAVLYNNDGLSGGKLYTMVNETGTPVQTHKIANRAFAATYVYGGTSLHQIRPGHVATPLGMPIPAGAAVSGMRICPDGESVAVNITYNEDDIQTWYDAISVWDLRTHHARILVKASVIADGSTLKNGLFAERVQRVAMTLVYAACGGVGERRTAVARPR